jgi:hypothetical protein
VILRTSGGDFLHLSLLSDMSLMSLLSDMMSDMSLLVLNVSLSNVTSGNRGQFLRV